MTRSTGLSVGLLPLAGLLLCAAAGRDESMTATGAPASPAAVRAAAEGPPASPPGAASGDPVLRAMRKELARTMEYYADEDPPLYHLAYQVVDSRSYSLRAELGALVRDNRTVRRSADVDARVGSPRRDNTHQIKGDSGGEDELNRGVVWLPVDDDEGAIRAALWRKSAGAVAAATQRHAKATTNQAVTAEERDRSDDFSREEPPPSIYERPDDAEPDLAPWRAAVRRLSALFKPYPFLRDSWVELEVDSEDRRFVSSEGALLRTGDARVRLYYRLEARSEDGMDLERGRDYYAPSLADLPDEARVQGDIARSAGELEALLKAPAAEPFTGPVILRSRASAVFFHEIVGHRLEGHRQKLESEGQTFADKIGRRVASRLLTLHDDPTLRALGGEFLAGHYLFDDEGVRARPVTLIEDGVLRGFLMSRSPVEGFQRSNGHGRRQAGYFPVARQANLLLKVRDCVPYDRLRRLLLSEIRRQRKPYGLVFEDIKGGQAQTARGGQSFTVDPLLVYRVFPDGRPDQVVRGVEIVGTPLSSLGKIVAAACDVEAFNGFCGAESGLVRVSASAPSLLVSELEVAKKELSARKPPILPPPHHDREGVE